MPSSDSRTARGASSSTKSSSASDTVWRTRPTSAARPSANDSAPGRAVAASTRPSYARSTRSTSPRASPRKRRLSPTNCTGVLISCATPAASWPTASSRCASRRSSSTFSRSRLSAFSRSDRSSSSRAYSASLSLDSDRLRVRSSTRSSSSRFSTRSRSVRSCASASEVACARAMSSRSATPSWEGKSRSETPSAAAVSRSLTTRAPKNTTADRSADGTSSPRSRRRGSSRPSSRVRRAVVAAAFRSANPRSPCGFTTRSGPSSSGLPTTSGRSRRSTGPACTTRSEPSHARWNGPIASSAAVSRPGRAGRASCGAMSSVTSRGTSRGTRRGRARRPCRVAGSPRPGGRSGRRRRAAGPRRRAPGPRGRCGSGRRARRPRRR